MRPLLIAGFFVMIMYYAGLNEGPMHFGYLKLN
jgi:hypothetical protein